ncbi:MAG TPA: MEDS domain-containing protein [Candidatus Omnitrophota bacterium]|nr:MEDS domain-containing protein [Candidatus Omnitrophota bacterium]
MGIHSCLFYETKKDLYEIIVPYFEEGFRKNEFCIWIIAEPLGILDIYQYAPAKAVLFQQQVADGKLKVMSAHDWYLDDGRLRTDKILSKWKVLTDPLSPQKFSGIRASGDMAWLDMRNWEECFEFEHSVDEFIKKKDITALCTYPSLKFKEAETFLLSTCHSIATKNKNGFLEYVLYGSK